MDLHSKTILLVEDNPDDVLLVQRACTKAGLTCTLQTVSNTDSAIAYLSGSGQYGDRDRFQGPAVVLLDLKLPGRPGFDLLGWIRDHAELRTLPVVVFTSSRESPDIQRAYSLGANSYLTKPVRFDDLLQLIRTLNLYWLDLNENPALF